jgi:hypothetical protein
MLDCRSVISKFIPTPARILELQDRLKEWLQAWKKRTKGLPQQLQERENPNDRKHAINFITYFIVRLEKSISGSGNFNFILSSLSMMISATAQLRIHFRFAGITYHGAHEVLHLVSASS